MQKLATFLFESWKQDLFVNDYAKASYIFFESWKQDLFMNDYAKASYFLFLNLGNKHCEIE